MCMRVRKKDRAATGRSIAGWIKRELRNPRGDKHKTLQLSLQPGECKSIFFALDAVYVCVSVRSSVEHVEDALSTDFP